MRVCRTCKVEKSLEQFPKNKSKLLGRDYACKVCVKDEQTIYRHSKIGVETRMYNSQFSASKKRCMPMPTYTKEEFIIWLYNNNFDILYSIWVESGYDKAIKPSVNRLNDYLPYTFDNIELITWDENLQKQREAVKIGTNRKSIKTVVQLKDDKVIAHFHSVREAFRKTNIRHISDCCTNKRKTAGGFEWQHLGGVLSER